MSVIGIDFGTSFCTAAWVNPKTGLPEPIMFPQGVEVYKLPSVVMFPSSGNPVVGTSAYNQLLNATSSAIQSRTITSVKRKMRQGGNFLNHSHTEIISMIIRHVVEQAKKAVVFPDEPDHLVLTHPVKFEEWKKEMLRQAAVQAGFASNNIQLIEEPVAAALEYVKSTPQAKTRGIMVYDFGGGTFDVAYVQIDHLGKPQIPIDTQCDPRCGGDDIDMLVYDHWENLARQQHNRPLSANAQEADLPFLMQCRKDKELLSSTPNYTVKHLLPIIQGRGLDRCEWKCTESGFNQLVAPIVDKTLKPTRQVLEEVQRRGLPLDVVLLVGGSSRIPLVEQRLKDVLQDKATIRTTGKVDTAVSVGAVYYATEGFSTSQTRSDNPFKYCIRCGNKLNDGDNYCMMCGQKRCEMI